ncbi:MAG TPA: BrnT family toxin [Rhodospirillales bacterium]|nr:BrnT family toxin [Rhodospirillales bacterium]HJO68473.1 BrnT family toxin [Rhodospirillales bacterium]
MRWTWDPNRDRNNRRVHGLGYETARLVFDDPLAVPRPDPYSGAARWQTVGLIANVAVRVAHTWPDPEPDSDEHVGRIVSARKAARHERKAYEEGEF